ncbi:MAG: hypothetical protein IPH18_18065 [Chitinophagaceae bacterium]|nr:hypothetical protein [Chitinophagaceae bacterium]
MELSRLNKMQDRKEESLSITFLFGSLGGLANADLSKPVSFLKFDSAITN